MSTCWHAPFQPKWHNRFNPPNLKLKCLSSSFKKERTTLWLKLPTVAFKVLELKKKKSSLFLSEIILPTQTLRLLYEWLANWVIYNSSLALPPATLSRSTVHCRLWGFPLLFHCPLQTLVPFPPPAVASLKLVNCTECPLYTTLVATGYWVFRYV